MRIHHQFRSLLWVQVLLLLICLGALSIVPAQDEEEEEGHKQPVFITARVFQGRVKRGASLDLSDQTFRISNQALSDYDRFVSNLNKAYPALEIAQVRTELLRIFPSPNPGRLQLGPKQGRNLQLLINVAQSPGDGVTPGLSIVPMVEYHFGDKNTDRKYPPVTQAFPMPIEAEKDKTYFFTKKDLSYSTESYLSFLRPTAAPKHFQDWEFFFIFTITLEPEDPRKPGGEKPTARFLNEKDSLPVQAAATKKVEPAWPIEIQQPGYDGSVQVRVQINNDGKVVSAMLWNSTVPEANRQVLEAARQWTFPASLFADNKLPVSALLTFAYKAPEVPPKSSASKAK